MKSRLLTHLLVSSCLLVFVRAQLVTADSLQINDPRIVVPNKVKLAAQAFDLRQVHLLDGPFKQAQERDKAYLLSLDPGRLLHTFRINAGLPSPAAPLSGWEDPKCELRGHFTGHYLSACSLMYAATGDERLKEKVEAVVSGLAACQEKLSGGYLSAFPESYIDRVEARQNVWAPYYTLHKLYEGLLDAYVYCDNTKALETCRKFGDWVKQRNDKLSDTAMQAMLLTEHGGMNEALADLYALTGDGKYLETSLRFNHRLVIDSAARGVDNLTGLHANTQIPKFVGAARQFELTGESSLRSASEFFWNTVVKERSYVIGGNSDGEMFTPKERLSTALGPNTTETCNTYNMLKLTRHLFCWKPLAQYGDYYERALYNHILASQNPADGMMCYYVPLRGGSHKEYNTPLASFWCCTGTGVENHAKHADSIYFHSSNSTLFVNLFISSELDWKDAGLRLRQESSLPESGKTRLIFQTAKPLKLEVRVRRPTWAGEFVASINGKQHEPASAPGAWLALTRTWHNGDVLDLSLPFSLRTESFADNPARFAVLYGPLVLGTRVDVARPLPAFVSDRPDPKRTLKAGPVQNTFKGAPEFFRSPDGQPCQVLLEPFYALHGAQPYMVYFDSLSSEAWESKEREYAAEVSRRRELADLTVDLVVPDGKESEKGHEYRGDKSAHGEFRDRKWRHASDGGWFSYKMKINPGQPQDLMVTYWGSDSAGRVFDILVDGEKIVTQRLESNYPEKFYDETYALPEPLLQGKEAVTVRFQAHPGKTAGGVFETRILRREK